MVTNNSQEAATVFNPMQLQLLRMFSYVKTEEQLKDIKSALSAYFFNRVEEDMAALEQAGKWSQAHSDEVMKEHLHTPYVY